MSVKLHWSFDYTPSNGEEFVDELIATLEAAYGGGLPAGPAAEYTVLPNHWGGYARMAQRQRLAFGSLSIRRTPGDNAVDYRVESCNMASGEALRLRFQTDTSPLRRLRGRWRIDARNDAPDPYNEFNAAGRVTDSGRIEVAAGGLTFVAEQLPDDRPLLCNWTLFDALPGLATLPGDAEFALLEDLEKLRPRCRVRPLGAFGLPVAGTDLELRGLTVFGEAQPPFHFWLDARDNVAIASSTFNTYVMRNGAGAL